MAVWSPASEVMYSWLVGHTYWTVVAGGGTTFCTESKASVTLGESTEVFCAATQNNASSGVCAPESTFSLVAASFKLL